MKRFGTDVWKLCLLLLFVCRHPVTAQIANFHIDTSTDTGMYLSAGFNTQTNPPAPAFAYYSFDGTRHALVYNLNGTPTIVDTEGIPGVFTSLGHDGGTPYIAYYELTNRAVKVAYISGFGMWSRLVVASGTPRGYVSLAHTRGMLGGRTLHVSYLDLDVTGSTTVVYARSVFPYTTWTRTVLSSASIGQTSIGIDATNTVYIAFIHEGSLKLATVGETGVDSIATVDPSGGVTTFCSLRVFGPQSAYKVGIAYYSLENQTAQAKLALMDGNGRFSIFTVDRGGSHISLAGTTQWETLRLAYYDALRNTVKVARMREPGDPQAGWWTFHADTMTDVGTYASIVMNENPQTREITAIAGYYDAGNRRARALLWVNGNPRISVAPSSRTLSYQAGGVLPFITSTFSVTNTGEGAPLLWKATTTVPWLSVTPASGTLQQNASTAPTIIAHTFGLSTGVYTGTIVVYDPYALNSSATVTVTLTVTKPIIGFTTDSLSFSAVQGGPNPPAQMFGIRNDNPLPTLLQWTASESVAWMSLSSTAGLTTSLQYSTVTVSVDIGGLPVGVYATSITVSDPQAMNSPQYLPVTLTVSSYAWPAIGLSTATLEFSSVRDSTAMPEVQRFTITNTGVFGSTLSWQAAAGALWLTLVPTTGTLHHNVSTVVTVAVNPSGLPMGVYRATITVSDPAASNSPQYIAVTLRVLGRPAIGLSTTTVTLTAYATSPGIQRQDIRIANSGDPNTVLSWTAADNAPWLTVSPSSGSLPTGADQNVTVNVNSTNLSTGVHVATVTFVDPNASNSPQQLRVTLNVLPEPACSLGAQPSALTFYALAGDGNPSPQPLYLTNTGPVGSIARWTAQESAVWLSLAPTSGTAYAGATSTVTVAVNTAGLPAGRYTHSIVITASNCTNSPQTVQVQMIISTTAYPAIGLSRTNLGFSAAEGGADPAPQTFGVTNTGMAGSTLTWTASPNAPWLTVIPSSGANQPSVGSTVTVRATVAGMPVGVHRATITVSDPNATNNPQYVAVTLTVSSAPLPLISVRPSTIAFSAVLGGGNPAPAVLTVTNTGLLGSVLNWQATDTAVWLSLAPTSGTLVAGSSTAVSVSPSIAGLSTGTYTATITVDDPVAPNSPQMVAVVLTVAPAPVPAIGLNRSSITFLGGSGSGTPPAQTFTVSNTGTAGSTLTFTVTGSAAWLTIAPTSGSVVAGGSPVNVSVGVNTSGLSTGTYTATITVADPAASNSPQTITVTLILDDLLHPTIGLSQDQFAFVGTVGGANPPAQPLTVTNTGIAGSTLVFSISGAPAWLSATPSSGYLVAGDSTTVALAVDISGLSSGTYIATLSIVDPNATNSPQLVTITLTVNAPAVPSISLSRSAVAFSVSAGAANPAPQVVVLTNTGDVGSSLGWTVVDDAAWLNVTPAAGTLAQGESADLALSVNVAGLAPGTYHAVVTVSAPGAANDPQTIGVTLTVSAPSAVSLPVEPGDVRIQGGEQGYVYSGQGEIVRFVLWPKESGTIRFRVYSLRGVKVWEMEKTVSAGAQQYDWAVLNNDGQKLAGGVYVLTVKGAGLDVRKRIAVRN